MQLSTRSIRLGSKETFPAGKLESPQVDRQSLPCLPDARSSFQLPQHNLGHRGGAGTDQPSQESLETSFSAQKLAERLPSYRLPPASLQTSPRESLSEQPPLSHFGFEEQTGQLQEDPPPTQLDLDKLELKHMMLQLLEAIAQMHQAAHSLDAKLAKAEGSKHNNNNDNNRNNNNNDNNNDNTTNNNHNNNHHNNHTDSTNSNNNNNNKNCRELGLNSFDLDKSDPESESDLDAESLGSFTQTLGGESSLLSLDHQEANLSLGNLGHQTLAVGLSLGSFSQQNQDGQEGQIVGTAYDISLDSLRAKLGTTKPRKRVTFGTVTWEAYNQQDELQNENNKSTTCWNSFQQENAMQQQTATASRGGHELRPNHNHSLGREEQTLGNIQQACRCPSNNNTSNLGIGPKNKAAWGILIDTGAAISLE